MKMTEKVKKFLNRNNPELISDEIAQTFNERRENGEENPFDDTAKDIMQILKEHPDIIRTILEKLAENEEVPDKLIVKTAIKISESEDIPNSVITDVVNRDDKNISDESIKEIIEKGNFENATERISLIRNVENEKIVDENIKNELKILYKVCKEKKDYEVVERVDKLKELLDGREISEEIQNLIKQVVAKKMAENYYRKEGTTFFQLSKILPVEDMIENDLPSMVEQEYKKIEENEGSKEKNFDKKGLKILILKLMGKNIAYRYNEIGVFIIPQSENMKDIDKEEEEEFIKSIQTYSGKQLSKQEIIDIDEQIRGNSNNVQIKENILINLIKNIPENNKRRIINSLIQIVSNSKEWETLLEMQETGLIDKFSKLPDNRRKNAIKIVGKTIEKRENITVVKPPRIEKQTLKMHEKEQEGR